MNKRCSKLCWMYAFYHTIVHNSEYMKKLRLLTCTSVTNAYHRIPNYCWHPLALCAGRPTQSMQNQKWSYGLTVFVAACPSSSGSFPLCGDSAIGISSVGVMLSIMDCVCQVGSFAFHLSDFVGPTCICISPYLRSQKGPQRTCKARTVSIG